ALRPVTLKTTVAQSLFDRLFRIFLDRLPVRDDQSFEVPSQQSIHGTHKCLLVADHQATKEYADPKQSRQTHDMPYKEPRPTPHLPRKREKQICDDESAGSPMKQRVLVCSNTIDSQHIDLSCPIGWRWK